MENTIEKVVSWAGVRCKFTIYNCIGGSIKQEDRENGLSRILTFDIAESEVEWLNYYKEETQISKDSLIYSLELDLSDMILDSLFDETLDIMLVEKSPAKI